MPFTIPGSVPAPAPVNRRAPSLGGSNLPNKKKKKKAFGKPSGMAVGLPSLPGAPMPPQPVM